MIPVHVDLYRVSAFADWIEDELENVTVNAAYFNKS